MKLAVLAFALFAAVVAEPEAEASPEAYYGHYGYGLGYRGYGYGAGYYGRGYGYGYPYHGYGHGYYRGKRSADADPALFYGAYSPYAYVYAPYAYAPLGVASGSSFQHVSTPAATYESTNCTSVKLKLKLMLPQTHTMVMLVTDMDTHITVTVMAVPTDTEADTMVDTADTEDTDTEDTDTANNY